MGSVNATSGANRTPIRTGIILIILQLVPGGLGYLDLTAAILHNTAAVQSIRTLWTLGSGAGHDVLGAKVTAQRRVATRTAEIPSTVTGVGGTDFFYGAGGPKSGGVERGRQTVYFDELRLPDIISGDALPRGHVRLRLAGLEADAAMHYSQGWSCSGAHRDWRRTLFGCWQSCCTTLRSLCETGVHTIATVPTGSLHGPQDHHCSWHYHHYSPHHYHYRHYDYSC